MSYWGGCCVRLAASSVLSVLMRCCLLPGVTGESCSAISRMLNAALEQKHKSWHSLVWHILPWREPQPLSELWSSSSAEIKKQLQFSQLLGTITAARSSCQRAGRQSLNAAAVGFWQCGVPWAVLCVLWDVLVGCEACLDCLCPTESPVISWGNSPQALGVGACKRASFHLGSWSTVP